MTIEFRQVSYAYDRAAAKRTLRASRGVRAKRTAHPQGSVRDDRRRWGNEPDQVWALEAITLTIEEGEFLGVAGHTGSGKSTFLLALAGLITPTQGSVVVTDSQGRSHAPAERRGQIGVVFQYPEHQLFAPTVLEDVSFGPRNLGLSDDEVHDRAERALARVGLDPVAIADRSPFELSGGQQRRAALAGVLAMEPSVLAMDEPAAGLDPRGMNELRALVRSLHDDGITCVMISHSMADLAAMADRVLVLNGGTIAACGPPAQVFSQTELLKAAGLRPPAALSVADRLRKAGLALPEGILAESELIAALSGLLKDAGPSPASISLPKASSPGESGSR